MKKIIAFLLTGCILISGCSSGVNETENSSDSKQDSSFGTTATSVSEQNLFETENLITKSIENIEYSIPESWESGERVSGNNIYYYDEGLMIMLQTQDVTDYESLNDLSDIEKKTAKDSFTGAVLSAFGEYTEITNEYTEFLDNSAIKLIADIDYNDYAHLELLFLIEDYVGYSFIITSDDRHYNSNKEIFESFLDSIKFLEKTESDNPYQDTVDAMKELYIESANDIEQTESNSEDCFEIVLKTSKELFTTYSDYEELVDDDLFTVYANAAGYLCNYFDEDSEYGKVGDLAFELIAYTVAEDENNKNSILSEFGTIAAEHGWSITTLDETLKPNANSSSSNEVEGVEIVDEYTLTDSIGWYTRRFLIVRNNNNYTVDITTSSLAYSADGSMVSAADGYVDAVGPGCTSIFYEAFETSAQIDHYDTTFNVSKSEYYESVIQDLSYTQNDIDGGAIFQVTNNGSEPAEFVEGYALFFAGDQLVDYQSTYFIDDDSELKPGKTISEQITAYENFDSIEFYLTGRRSVW